MSGATAIVTGGTIFPDAIGVSPLACAKRWPILLTRPTSAVPTRLCTPKPPRPSGLDITTLLRWAPTPPCPAGVTGVANCSGADRYYTNANVAIWAGPTPA